MATAVKDTAAAAGEYQLAPIGIIQVDQGFNNRRSLGNIDELTSSIQSVGILQPLLVWKRELGLQSDPTLKGKGFLHVIAGHRRLAAAQQAGLTHVPVIIVEHDEKLRLESLLVENLHRLDLDPLEEADGYRRLVDLGLSQKEVADKVGRSQAHISKRVGLLNLPVKLQEKVHSGGISVGDALELVKLVDHPEALKQIRLGDGYRPVAGQVAQELEEIKQSKARIDALRGLKERKVAVIETKGGFYGFYSVKDRPLKGQGNRYDRDGDALSITVKKHEGEPCHAARVMQTGEVVYVCADPKRHAKDDPKMAKAAARRDAEKAEEKALRKAKAEASAARLAVLQQLIRSADSQLQFATTQLASSERTDAGRVACEILNLEAEPSRHGMSQFAAALEKRAAHSKKASGEVLLALAFAQAEAEIRNGWGGGERQRRHMELLKGAGYVPNAADEKVGEVDEDDRCKVCGKSIDEALDRMVADEEEAYLDSSSDTCFDCWKAGASVSKTDGIIPDSPEPVIEDYPTEEREKILLDTANSVLEGIEHVADPKVKAERVQTATELIAQAEQHVGPPVGQPVSQRTCRECHCHEDCAEGCVWVELVDAGPLCSNCQNKKPVAATAPEKAGPIDQRARR